MGMNEENLRFCQPQIELLVRVSGSPARDFIGKVLEMKECYREVPRILHVFLDWAIMQAWGRCRRGNTEHQGELRSDCNFQFVSQPHTDLTGRGMDMARRLLVQRSPHCPTHWRP